MRRIGIDARMINASGIGRYIKNLLLEFQKLDKENNYFIFLLKEDYEKINFTKNFQSVLADFRWYGIKEQRKFPPILNRYKLDLLHVPHFNVPIFYQGKFIVTIHDLIHLDFKMKRASTHSFLTYEIKHQLYKQLMKKVINKSQKILTPSNFVKEEIVTRWKIGQAKITVTQEAVEDYLLNLIKRNDEKQAKETREKFNIKLPFLFYVGNAHPHKNVEGLIKAFLELRKNYQYLQLVLSGNDSYFWQRIRQEYHHQAIIYTGFVTDRELVALYKGAQAYVFPSFSEGFGIPLLEAMACGTPVVSSNQTSLPEVGKDAAVYFNPHDQTDMVKKISLVLNDQKLRKSLIKKGEERVKGFSWKKLAKQTLAVYNGSLNG